MARLFSIEDLALLNDIRDAVSQNAEEKGFTKALQDLMTPEQWEVELGQLVRAAVMTANQVGESSEFWEAFRAGALDKPCDKAEKMVHLGLAPLLCKDEEIADEIIRAFDKAKKHNVDVAKAVAVKMAYNASRPALHGGKKA